MNGSSIGVVIPAMNSSAFIDQALGSLAMQTRPVDQVVVIDDHSDDNTPELVERWHGILPLTLLRHQKRRGVWGARKSGIAALSTELVMQLDGDDVLLPHHAAAMADAYRAAPGLISPRPLTWTGEGPYRPASYPKGQLPRPGDQLRQLLAQNYVLVGAMYPRALYESVGGYRQIRYGEEWDLWLRLVAAGAPVSKPAEPSYVYRVRAGSYAGSFARDEAETEVLHQFLAECGQPAYRRAVKLALLQRTGTAALPMLLPGTAGGLTEPLRSFAKAHELPLDEVYEDPDLGWVLSFREPGRQRVVVADDEAWVALELETDAGGGAPAVCSIEDELLRRDASSLRDVLRDA